MIAWLLLGLVAEAVPGPPVVVTVTESSAVLVAGESTEVEVRVRIEDGFRIQANPASDPFLVPARLELPSDERVEVGTPSYPPGRPYRLRGAAEDLSVYQGDLVIRVPLRARSGAVEGRGEAIVLDGRLHFQACNERMCLRPSSTRVEVSLSVRPRQP